MTQPTDAANDADANDALPAADAESTATSGETAVAPPSPPPPAQTPPPPPPEDGDPSVQPDRVKAIAIMLTVSGGLNVFAALGSLLNVAAAALSTWGIGLIFCYIPIVLGIAGYFGLMDGIRLLQRSSGLKAPTTAAYAQIAAILGCNPVSLALGIIILVFLGEQPVKDYFARQRRH